VAPVAAAPLRWAVPGRAVGERRPQKSAIDTRTIANSSTSGSSV
jgi:hypothetical protein